MTPAKHQYTVVEFIDYAAPCHKVQEVRVNGFPVRVEPDSLVIGVSNGRNSTATTVTLTLQVDEIHFSHETAESGSGAGRSTGPHVTFNHGSDPAAITRAVEAKVAHQNAAAGAPFSANHSSKVAFLGGPLAGCKTVMTKTPAHVEFRGERYERINDPDTGEFLGGYAHVPASDEPSTPGKQD